MAIDQDGNPVTDCHCDALNAFLRMYGLGMVTRCSVCVDDIVEAKNRVVVELQGHVKALDLMNRGMESQCELMDGLKQEVRRLKGVVEGQDEFIRLLQRRLEDQCRTSGSRSTSPAPTPSPTPASTPAG